jgi:hypothetical protein
MQPDVISDHFDYFRINVPQCSINARQVTQLDGQVIAPLLTIQTFLSFVFLSLLLQSRSLPLIVIKKV